MQEISTALYFNQWAVQFCSHWSQWQNPSAEVEAGSDTNSTKYAKWVFRWWPISCIRVLITTAPEIILPLTFYYPQISTKHNIQLPLLHVCISPSWYFKLIGKESLRAKHNRWDNWLHKTTMKEWAKFSSNLSIPISAQCLK